MTTAPDTSSSILIVDDMEENLVALEAVLGSLTQKVVRARSGEEALKAMLREEFAVVLIDVLMPGMNGFETAANIKGLDQTKDVPIILLTGASVDPNYAYRGYTVGAADFLIKPFDPWLLRTKVNVFLDLHRKNRQLAAQAEQLKRLLTSDDHPADEGPPPATTATTTAPAAPTGTTTPMTTSAAATAAGTEAAAPSDATSPPPAPSPAGSGVAEHPPIPPGGPGAPTPAEPYRQPTQPTAPGAGDASRLADIAGQLAEVELLLRDAKGSDKERLADRITELEEAVGRLLVSRGT
ncbi:Response regulator receiver domain-containing protein [Streptomyces sp. 2224.1]|uniref:response regulator n=1 Tax=unclassified Streptomyces TaxID=2593676 RepID=UPI000894B7B2|nr:MULTISPECIES: response regulator [unclassified Streptomyces]SEB92498.1 Response regulator receiver domain-containing protein [Streptomyces sp. 2224.1]SEE68368.1 Response regulator receiver domain-containing protein [Streptomyces sp. 2112.3]